MKKKVKKSAKPAVSDKSKKAPSPKNVYPDRESIVAALTKLADAYALSPETISKVEGPLAAIGLTLEDVDASMILEANARQRDEMQKLVDRAAKLSEATGREFTYNGKTIVESPEMKKAKADAPAKPKQSEGTSSSTRNPMLGQSMTAVVRWMGHQGWDFKQIRKCLDTLGVECADNTIRRQSREGRLEQLPLANVTSEQAAQLREAAGIDQPAEPKAKVSDKKKADKPAKVVAESDDTEPVNHKFVDSKKHPGRCRKCGMPAKNKIHKAK